MSIYYISTIRNDGSIPTPPSVQKIAKMLLFLVAFKKIKFQILCTEFAFSYKIATKCLAIILASGYAQALTGLN